MHANRQDEHHRKVINVVRKLSEPVILPLTVLPEICYLLDTRLGHASMRQFVANVLTGAMELTSLNKADIARALKILQQYGAHELTLLMPQSLRWRNACKLRVF